jgi:hypothetical protein
VSRPASCSSITTATGSTCWTPRATRTSPRTRTGLSWRRTAPSCCWTTGRESRSRRASCSRSASSVAFPSSRSSTRATGPVRTRSSSSTTWRATWAFAATRSPGPSTTATSSWASTTGWRTWFGSSRRGRPRREAGPGPGGWAGRPAPSWSGCRTRRWIGCVRSSSCWSWPGPSSTPDAVQSGELSPTFFGSALTNFGVEPLLRHFLQYSPRPAARETEEGRAIQPEHPAFTGFVFKIQANMDPRHRDRIAFLRVCSGHFEPGMQVANTRSGDTVRLAQPQQFMAQDRQVRQ